MNCPSEHAEQVEVVNWLDFIAPRLWPDLAIVDGWAIDSSKYSMKRPQWRLPYFAVPNGGNRHAKTAKDLKDEGVRSGIPDLLLMVPRCHKHGMTVEMKRVKGGSVDKAQRMWGNALVAMGYHAVVCRGHEQAIEAITIYLNEGGKP